MSIEQIIQEKMARLQELRQYQAHYGPYTAYPIIVEINQLESELGHLLRTSGVHPQAVGKQRQKPSPKKKITWRERLGLSQSTMDILISLAFIGVLFFLAAFFMMAYFYNLSQTSGGTMAYLESFVQPAPLLRPTFTPTVDPNAPLPAQVAEPKTPTPLANSYLPTPAQATNIPTPVPTITPRISSTPTPAPTSLTLTDTPVPTKPPPTPIQVSIQQANTPTPVPPTPVPAPSYAFRIVEQGNRAFQKTAYHGITIYVAVVSEGNVPVGGYQVVGNHVPSGRQVVSDLSTWHWSVVNCLDCDYVKQGNLKFEPGTFEDGTWNIYLTDSNGQQLSPVVSFSYSADPNQWVWDFIIFRRISG